MKKIMMTLATLFVAVCASAQVYIGGGFSLANTSVDDDSYFSWKIAPEIGFQFDKKWDAGVSLGYTGVENGQKVFELAPYVRYTVCGSKVVDFFIEGTVGYAHYDNKKPLDDYDAFEIGLKPGLKVNLSKHMGFRRRRQKRCVRNQLQVLRIRKYKLNIITNTNNTNFTNRRFIHS